MIKTKRLLLKPLNADELLLAANDPNQLDKHLYLNTRSAKGISESHVKKAIDYRSKMVLEHPDDFEWYTQWQLIESNEHVIVGGIMPMPERNEGEVKSDMEPM